jgi:hypothetical protein
MPLIALLTEDALFLAAKRVDRIPDHLPPFTVAIPGEQCDLAPGEARWDPDRQSFVFVKPRRWAPGIYSMRGGGTFTVHRDGSVDVEEVRR